MLRNLLTIKKREQLLLPDYQVTLNLNTFDFTAFTGDEGISECASEQYFDKLAMPCCAEADVADRKRMRKQFAEEYFNESK